MDVGLILAGGRSERFGAADKLLAPLAGKPLIAHAAAALIPLELDATLVVAGSEAVAQAAGAIPVLIDNRETGQSASLHAGVRAAMAQGAMRLLVVLGDMPFVTAEHLGQVLSLTTGADAAATRSGDRPMPPAAFRRAVFPDLLATKGDRGASALLRALPLEALVTATPDLVFDVDTPAALQEAVIRNDLSHS